MPTRAALHKAAYGSRLGMHTPVHVRYVPPSDAGARPINGLMFR